MALLAAGSALVAGISLEQSMKTSTIRVTRAFFYQGQPIAVGKTIEVPEVFARELVDARKAEIVEVKEPIKAKAPEAAKT